MLTARLALPERERLAVAQRRRDGVLPADPRLRVEHVVREHLEVPRDRDVRRRPRPEDALGAVRDGELGDLYLIFFGSGWIGLDMSL